MKSLLSILTVFVYSYVSCQTDRDTIILNQSDVIIKVDTIYNTRTNQVINILNINKNNGILLNGLYKININENNYFITNYKNGNEDNSVFNIYKGYQNGTLKQLDIKGYQIIGSNYISIPTYDCSSNVFLDGFIKKYSNSEIVNIIRIHQKIKNKIIQWKIYYPDKTKRKLRFNKTSLNLCE